MKKILSLVIIMIMLAVTIAVVPAEALETTVSYEKKDISLYALGDRRTAIPVTGLVREDLPEVPYISVEDYLRQLYSSPITISDNGGGSFSFTKSLCSMSVDAERDTISFDSYEYFLFLDLELNDDDDIYPQEQFLSNEAVKVDLELGKYGIDIVAVDGAVYLPYITLNDIFSETYRAAEYKNGKLMFVQADSKLNYVNTRFEDTREKALAEYTYNELCFVMDNFYGFPSKAILSDSIEANGFDGALAGLNNVTARIRELLRSQSTEEYFCGLKLLDYYLDDGEHTQISKYLRKQMSKYGISDMTSAALKVFGDTEAEEVAAITEAQARLDAKTKATLTLSAKKTAVYKDFETIKNWQFARLCRSGDTYFFDFDSFNDNIIEPFKWSMDYAAENDARSFIIDLSTNGGGTTIASDYILSLICGEVTYYMKNTLSGKVWDNSLSIDKNLDGVVDEQDETVSYDFPCAILTSQRSYSCANLLPCIAQDNGIAILGETASGGCCGITAHFYPDGSVYSLSGTEKFIHPDGVDFDTAAVPDTALPGAEADYEGFYDIDAINAGIAAFYGKPVEDIIRGDADGSGEFDITDVTAVQRRIAMFPMASFNETAADADGNGEVEIIDATLMQRVLAQITTFEKWDNAHPGK